MDFQLAGITHPHEEMGCIRTIYPGQLMDPVRSKASKEFPRNLTLDCIAPTGCALSLCADPRAQLCSLRCSGDEMPEETARGLLEENEEESDFI